MDVEPTWFIHHPIRGLIHEASLSIEVLHGRIARVVNTHEKTQRLSPGAASIARKLIGREFDFNDVERVFANLFTRCLVCDDVLLSDPTFVSKRASLCSKDLCRFTSMAYGVGIPAEWMRTHDLDVFDLIVGSFFATAKWDLAWNDEANMLCFDPDISRRLGSTVADRKNNVLRPEFGAAIHQWCISDNAAIIVTSDSLATMFSAEKAFVFQTSDLSRENEFRTRAAEMGTRFLFTGTHNERVFPILKRGPRILSGTQFQRVGAVYGPGIYASNVLDVAKGYSQKYVFVLEVIDDPNIFGGARDIVTIRDESAVRIRGVLVNAKQKFDTYARRNELAMALATA